MTLDVGQVADDQVAQRDVLLDDRRTPRRSACRACAGSRRGSPILPTSWSSPATRIVATSSGARPSRSAEEHAVASDVLGMPLRVAVLRVDGEDQALEDVEACASRARLDGRPGDPDRVAAARPSPPGGSTGQTVRSAVTESACSGNRHTPALTVSGRRSEALELERVVRRARRASARGRRSRWTEPAGATSRNSSGP